MRIALIALFVLLPLSRAFADTAQTAQAADSLHNKGMYADARALVLNDVTTAATGKEKAELYWRASRETLELGEISDHAKQPVADTLAIFTEGEAYADQAIAADPQNDLGYYWKSSNIGRWGQVKGILNALFKAGPMRDLLVKELSLKPDRSDAFYVLGQLYREVPGWPVSFGNVNAAVSLGRKSVDLRQAQVQAGTETELVYNFITELAKTLYKRNWSVATRIAEQKNTVARLASATTLLDKASAYEASVTLANVSDRVEAKTLVQGVVNDLQNLASLTAPEAKDLQSAKDVLKEW